MLLLIAESKTMTACDSPVSAALYERHRPVEESRADSLMTYISSLSPGIIMDLTHFSASMATKLHLMSRDFPLKGTGSTAIEAFTGIVFKALNYTTLTPADRELLYRDVRIVSSLYGWLRPDDIIKPYRLDYTSPLAPDEKTMSAYWRGPVTVNLVREIQETGCTSVLNLLPADAAKCIDWKVVKRFAKVWKIDFKELKEGATFATPHAGRLKTLRGHLLREIIKRHIDTPDQLLDLATTELIPMGTPDFPDHIAFCV